MTRPIISPCVGNPSDGFVPETTDQRCFHSVMGGGGQSTALVHLCILGEKIALFLGGADSGVVCPPDVDNPFLTIAVGMGYSLRIEVDAETECYLLHECGGDADSIVVVSSEGRLLDYVFGYLAGSSGGIPPKTFDAAVDFFVGHSLEEMEWRLIVRTLRRFQGDLAGAAVALGISLDSLRSKVHAHLYALRLVVRSSDEIQ